MQKSPEKNVQRQSDCWESSRRGIPLRILPLSTHTYTYTHTAFSCEFPWAGVCSNSSTPSRPGLPAPCRSFAEGTLRRMAPLRLLSTTSSHAPLAAASGPGNLGVFLAREPVESTSVCGSFWRSALWGHRTPNGSRVKLSWREIFPPLSSFLFFLLPQSTAFFNTDFFLKS